MADNYIHDYKEKLKDGTYALRVGNEVPEGDVNLGYIHTPRLDHEENIAIVNTSSDPGNVIPYEQKKSIVVPDQNGKLSYASLHPGADSIQEKSPFDLFPSKDLNITRQFKNNKLTTEDALYYKFEIMYHYDSMANEPNKVIKYTGDQIKLTDENGNPITSGVKYDIYVMASEVNPHIHWVKIYLNATTDEIDTFKIRYNHIDEITADQYIQSATTELELYRNAKNQLSVSGQAKQLVEGGKLRILNSGSAFTPVDKETFDKASDIDEVYHVVENPMNSGYEVYIKQKSEADPRNRKVFNYRIVAKYKDTEGNDQEVTTGYINDWVTNEEALLNHEKYAYTGEWKQIGIPNGNATLNVKDMTELALPLGTPSIPDEAVYEIYDAQGNLMYSTTDANDNPGVNTIIQEEQNFFGAAKANGLSKNEWHNAEYPNAMLKSYPIDHQVSIIAERQKTQWDYEFKMTGEGIIGVPTVYTGNWWACADVGIYKSFTSNPLDVLNKNKWNAMGRSITVNDWLVKTDKGTGKSFLELQRNYLSIGGFYQKTGPKGQDMRKATDYEFSTKVKMMDPGDDDVIGLLFRVNNDDEYYMFAWEGDEPFNDTYYYSEDEYPEDTLERPKENGLGYILLGEGGLSSYTYDPDIVYSNPKTPREHFVFKDWEDSQEYGFGYNKKRIYKVKKRPDHIEPYHGYSDFAKDKTGLSFIDITTKGEAFHSDVGKVGWKIGKEYKITLMVTGDRYQVYINENPDSKDRGTLVCEARDDTYKKGSVGVFCISQRWTQWRDLTYNELEVGEVCTKQFPITFDGKPQVRASNQRIGQLLKEPIQKYAKDKYGSSQWEIFSYNAFSDKDDIFLTIDEAGDGYIWAHTTNPSAGGKEIEHWTTTEHNLDIYGSGHIEYHEDGHFTITTDPKSVSTDLIPEYVENFEWNQPELLKGEGLTIHLEDDQQTIVVTPEVPSIVPLNRWITLKPDAIHISDGIVTIKNLNGPEGIIEMLRIPEDIPKHEILLRIERGEATSPREAINQEHRVNYRFRINDQGFIRYPVDQFKDQLGVNRLRLSGMYQEFLPVEFDINYEVLVPQNKATNMQDVFARNAPGAVMIESIANAATWKIVDGRLVDHNNNSRFVASYNRKHLSTKDHVTDFSFKTIGDDDDLVGVIFRVQDSRNFYFYALEGDKINPVMKGSRIANVQPGALHSWDSNHRKDYASDYDYVAKAGWKVYHQRVYQVKNGKKSVVAEKSTIINQGHMLNWQNNIRIESSGNITNLYFQTGTINEADWKRAYQIETEWTKGAYGVFNLSQTVEFLNIETSDLIKVSGMIPNLNYTGRPRAIMANNTRAFCHPYVKEKLESLGFTGDEDYTALSYRARVTNGQGEVSVSLTGEGPIQVFSNVDDEKMAADVDLVAWTHYEDLEASPVLALKIDEEKKIDIEKPKVERSKLEIENWYPRVKNGRFSKVIQLPYYEPEERTPSIYQKYPMLKDFAPREIDDLEEITLEYSIPEYTNQEFQDSPITLVERESPIILDEYSIQTKHHPLVLESNNHISYVEVEAFRNQQPRYLRVKDIDAKKGIIYLIDRIREQDEVFVRYAYYESWYTYRGFTDQEYELTSNTISERINYRFNYQLNMNGIIRAGIRPAPTPYSDSNVSFTIEPTRHSVLPLSNHTINIRNFSKPYKKYGSKVIKSDPNLRVGLSYGANNDNIQTYAYSDRINRRGVEGSFNATIEIEFEDGTTTLVELTYVFGEVNRDQYVKMTHRNEFEKVEVTEDKEIYRNIIVEEIPVASLFPDIEEGGSLEVNIDEDILESHNISGYSFNFKSDNRSIRDRQAAARDIIVVRVQYTIPVFRVYELVPVGGPTPYRLDLNPSPGHTHTVANDGFFEWIPVESPGSSISQKEKPSTELLVKPVHVYLRPAFIRDKTGKVIEGTQSSETIFHTDESHWFNEKDYKFDPTMFRLGKIIVQANSKLHADTVVLDTRTRGGGLDEALSRKIIESVHKESLHHWDIGYFDGQAYQENGVMIIRLPKTILKNKKNPNGFHETEVYEAVQKHKAYGVLPIIEYYDPEKLEKQEFPLDLNPDDAEIYEI